MSANFAVGSIVTLGATFTRPADTIAYASGDLVANNTTAGSVVPLTFTGSTRYNAGTGMVRRARLHTSSTSITSASFRVHLYDRIPTIANGDNAAWSTTVTGYLGSFEVVLDKAFSDGAKGIGVPSIGSEINFTAAAGDTSVYALIEARAAYTPTSAEVFTLALEIHQY